MDDGVPRAVTRWVGPLEETRKPQEPFTLLLIVAVWGNSMPCLGKKAATPGMLSWLNLLARPWLHPLLCRRVWQCAAATCARSQCTARWA